MRNFVKFNVTLLNRESQVRIGAFYLGEFLGLPDPDLLVLGTDPAPDPSIIKQNY
jgi:hypothetical protein